MKTKTKKRCNGCKQLKDASEFGLHKSSYKKKSTGQLMTYTYLRSRCRECEGKEAKVYYDQVKDVPEFKAKNIERVRKYGRENRDIINEKNRIKRAPCEHHQQHIDEVRKYYYDNKPVIIKKRKAVRQTENYKEYRKKYIEKNKDKIQAQERITKRRYHEKHRDNLTDKYVSNLLRTQGIPDSPPELIKLKKIQIIALRTIKIKQNGSRTTSQPNV